VCVYIYIYIERERERERESKPTPLKVQYNIIVRAIRRKKKNQKNNLNEKQTLWPKPLEHKFTN